MAVTDWVARYERAWRSPGTDALDELVTHTASYSPSPWAQPIESSLFVKRFFVLAAWSLESLPVAGRSWSS
jgi:hypothetical protein